ncbi:StfH/YfcO family fimbrial adhesin, partial [Escherichia coli]
MSIYNMKKWTLFFASLMLLVLNVVGTPRSYAGDKLMSSSFDSVRVYYAMDTVTGVAASIVFNVTVLTPGEVAYGKYNSIGRKGDTLRLISWTGSGPAPTLVITDYDTINNSHCPGIDTDLFRCAYMTFKVTVASDNYGCPWIASFYSYTNLPGYFD